MIHKMLTLDFAYSSKDMPDAFGKYIYANSYATWFVAVTVTNEQIL